MFIISIRFIFLSSEDGMAGVKIIHRRGEADFTLTRTSRNQIS